MSIQTISSLDGVAGGVIRPGDADYDKARTSFYGGVDRRPAAIVRVADANDVSRVIALVRETETEFVVRSGGHGVAGYAMPDGGIVLDLGDMRALDIDAERRTAWVETGVTAAEYTNAADAHGLATGFGDTGSVGLGGLTLGGGVGYLLRKHGLTIDDLIAAEIVTADGRLRRVDAESEPDLFWAIRGGGGNLRCRDAFPVPIASRRHDRGRDDDAAGDARRDPLVHRARGGRAGGAVDDRERHARAADAIRARRASRQARDLRDALLRRRGRGRRARRDAVSRARRADRRYGQAESLPRDVPAGGPELPPDRDRAHVVHRLAR